MHVKPIWLERYPHQEGLWRFLDDALRSNERGSSWEQGRRSFGRWQTYLDNALFGAVDFAPVYAGYAALRAAAASLWPAEPPAVASELDMDVYDWDACFLASVAAAGGATWEEGVGDDQRRRAYWEWYLAAVPWA